MSRHPKIRLEISPTCVDASTIKDTLKSKYKVVYCGIHSIGEKIFVYLHNKERLSYKIVRYLLGEVLDIKNISKFSFYEGDIIDSDGQVVKHGGHNKSNEVKRENSSISPSIKKQKIEPQPDTSLPSPSLKVSNCLTFLDNVYSRTVCGPMNPNGFHAVWSSVDGLWYPAMWVGPIRNISPSSRGTIHPRTINELLDEQDSKCRLCFTNVFMGTYSNSDVDHIVPLKHGGNCCKGNLQVLCVTCHRRKTALECKKAVAIMGDDDVTWLDNTVYLTNTHVHFQPNTIPSISSKVALVTFDTRPGLFILNH